MDGPYRELVKTFTAKERKQLGLPDPDNENARVFNQFIKSRPWSRMSSKTCRQINPRNGKMTDAFMCLDKCISWLPCAVTEDTSVRRTTTDSYRVTIEFVDSDRLYVLSQDVGLDEACLVYVFPEKYLEEFRNFKKGHK